MLVNLLNNSMLVLLLWYISMQYLALRTAVPKYSHTEPLACVVFLGFVACG